VSARVLALAASLLAAAALLVWGGGGAPPGTPPAPASAGAPPPATPAAPSPSPVAIPDPTAAVPEGPEPPEPAQPIPYPVEPHYSGRELSSVPHRVVGAWDEDEGPGRGSHRALVLVVDPALPDAELEDLARDALARHRDAETLIVRIYDSGTAARTPRFEDGGRAAARHLVATVRRTPFRETDRIEIRGRVVSPRQASHGRLGSGS